MNDEGVRVLDSPDATVAAGGRLDVLRTAAAAFRDGPHRDAIDLFALASLRLAELRGEGDSDAPRRESLRADLWNAIEEFPRATWGYVLLGHVHALGDDLTSQAMARDCYRRALEEPNWGPAHRAAQAALEEFGG